MLPHPEIWRGLTPGIRMVIWLSAICVSIALWGGYFWSGAWQTRKEGDMQIQRQLASLMTQRRQLWLREKALSRATTESELRATPFSALHFQSSAASLVSWKPDVKGGELVLETRWPPLPALFLQLAGQDMTPVGFTIEPEGSLLRLTLHLEALHGR